MGCAFNREAQKDVKSGEGVEAWRRVGLRLDCLLRYTLACRIQVCFIAKSGNAMSLSWDHGNSEEGAVVVQIDLSDVAPCSR